MTKSATQFASTQAARLAILREIAQTGKLPTWDIGAPHVEAMIDKGWITGDGGSGLVVTKEGLHTLAEASRCSGTS